MLLTVIRLNKLYSAQHLISRHPLRVALTCRLGCSLGRVCCPPLLHGVLKFQALQALVFSHFFCTTPFTSNLGALPWWPQWECSCLHFPPGDTFDLSDTSRRFAGFWFRFLLLLGGRPFLFLFQYDLSGHCSLCIRPSS